METRVTTRPYAVADGDGRATWFAGALLVHKAEGAATNHRFDLLDQTMPPGYVMPRHLHHAEDEARIDNLVRAAINLYDDTVTRRRLEAQIGLREFRFAPARAVLEELGVELEPVTPVGGPAATDALTPGLTLAAEGS